jgi:hypothetical protein
MARGFESKSVADQQESRSSPRAPREPGTIDPVRVARLRKLELSRADVLRRLATAQSPGHRQMLDRAKAALDAEIAALR